MSEARDNGGHAFPFQLQLHGYDYQLGMSLRDWFAGMAMMGLKANSDERICSVTREDIAVEAYRQADAMLEVRNL